MPKHRDTKKYKEARGGKEAIKDKEARENKEIRENKDKVNVGEMKKNAENAEKVEAEQFDEEYYEKLKQLGKIKEIGEKIKQEIEKGKEAVGNFKNELLKKYNFISAISLAIPMANKVVEENMEEEILARLEEEKKKYGEFLHVFVIVNDDKVNELSNISLDAIKIAKEIRPRIWLHFFTTNDLWQLCFDSKYEFVEAIAMSIPVHDVGILGALRVATIHKMMVLEKFEKYVVSYVLAGSIVRGQATHTSDVDVFIIIDDTDVKKMSRFELRERLRSIIYGYAIEANERANVKNRLSPQVYILTEFWEAVKESHPVIFTFIRDGVPLYDRGAFMPWKLLLRMGKIKPSPEAIEVFMSLGEKVVENVKKKLNTLITEDIYWGVITPSQAALMLYGIPPPTPKETVKLMKEIFVEKEKILEKRYIDILENIVNIYKKYEHEEKFEINGKEIDMLLEQISLYMERLKKLSEQLEEMSKQKTIEELLQNLNVLLLNIYGKKTMKEYLELIKKDFVNKGIVSNFYLNALKNLIELKKSKKKISIKDFELIRKDVSELIREIKDYSQKRELMEAIKQRVRIRYKKNGKIVEGEILFGKDIFLIRDVIEPKIEKFSEGKFQEASFDELKKSMEIKEKKELRLNKELISVLEKMFEDLEIIL